MTQASSPGKSADTFWGFIRTLDAFGAQWILLENSDLLLEEETADWGVMRDVLETRGFKLRPMMVDASEFGLPQRRRRSYLLGIATASSHHTLKPSAVLPWFRRFDEMLLSCRRLPPCLLDVILEPSSPWLQHAYDLVKQKPASSLQAGTCDIHMKLFSAAGSRWGAAGARDSSTASRWYQYLSYRQREVLIFFQQTHQNMVTICGADLSQSAHRAPTSSLLDAGAQLGAGSDDAPVLCPTILPGSHVWLMHPDPGSGSSCSRSRDTHGSLSEERPLLPIEKLLLQAWPIHNDEGPCCLKKHWGVADDLGGNMFAGTIMVSLLTTLLFTLPWSEEEADALVTMDDDVMEAMAALHKK